LPGFIDGHVHFPQTRVIGAFGEHLLPWLQKWVIPEEIKFKDRAYARVAAGRFFDNLVASGTTTCQAFTTTAPAATEELFDEAARRNMRLIAGLTGKGAASTPSRHATRTCDARADGRQRAPEARAPGLLGQHPPGGDDR
jgi:cytosine/adenosine deaminase-related metal-dependent hydrolase